MITNNSKCSSDSRQDQGQEGPRQEEGGGGGEPGGPDRLPAGQVHEGHPESGPGRQLRPGGDPGGAAQHHEGNQEEPQENQGGDLRAGGDGDGACQDQQVFTEDDQDRSRGGGEREGVTANKKIKQKVRFIFLFIQAIRKMQSFGAFDKVWFNWGFLIKILSSIKSRLYRWSLHTTHHHPPRKHSFAGSQPPVVRFEHVRTLFDSTQYQESKSEACTKEHDNVNPFYVFCCFSAPSGPIWACEDTFW